MRRWPRNPGFARAQKFYELGLRVEGNREWNWQLRGMSDRELLAAAEYARSLSLLDRMINTSDRTRNEFDFTQRFPSPFRDAMVQYAAPLGLDETWVYGLIRQESRFIMDARSQRRRGRADAADAGDRTLRRAQDERHRLSRRRGSTNAT